MVRVTGIDRLSIRVSNHQRSKAFHSRLFKFLGFELSDEYEDSIGWTNGKTRFWISPANPDGLKLVGMKYRRRNADAKQQASAPPPGPLPICAPASPTAT